MQISLFLALLAIGWIQLKAQSTAADLPSAACAPNQFECNCGEPRCVPQNAIGDGVADCADASDEFGRTGWEEFCGDGTKARRNKVKIGINDEEATRRPRFCTKERTRNCPLELGQICLEVNSHPRCVCRLGYFRPPRIPACIPIETFPHFDASNWVDLASEFKSGRLNCSRLISDLSNLYPGIFLYRKGQGRGIGKEQVIARDDPREDVPTDQSYQMLDFPPKFMFNKDEPEARCDPKNRESCGIGKICAAIGNGTDVWGKCVVPIDECAEPALNDCHKARCMDNDYGYECLCPEGFIDTSPNPSEMPGRNCRKLVNECLNPLQNDCSQNAECQDEPLGFICQCKVGFVDVGKRPGRNCVKGEKLDECTLGTADCDAKAICEDLTHGFRCRCPPGFIDNSPDAQNRPGRLCFPSSPEAKEYEDNFPHPCQCEPSTSECVQNSSSTLPFCRCLPGLVPAAQSDRSLPFRCIRPPGKGGKLGLQGALNNKGVKKNHNESNGSPSSTSSEISVGSAQFAATANNSQILLPQLRHIPAAGPNNTNGGTNFGGRSSHQLMYKMKEEIGVHHQNEVQMSTADAGGGGQLSSYQIISIPPSNAIQLQNDGSGNNYYQQQHGGAQNNSTSSAINNNGTAQPPRRKRAALEGQMHSGGGGQQQRGGRGGAHLEPERIVVNQPTHMQPVVVHPAQQQIHPNQQTSNNDRAVSTSALRLAPIVGRTNAADSAAQIQSTSTAGQLAQPQYILSTTQPQTPYATDQESAFIEMIVRHLRNLNEDEKVVTKMNIQRILMDARFGRGACVRMFNDELAMEQQRHMQQQHSSVNNSRR